VGCGQAAPRAALARFVLRDGSVEPDAGGTLPGRGAYLHRSEACAREALRRNAFARSFRAPVTTPDDLVERLLELSPAHG
jgi:uncharacterized protein